jgi:hypothetical protein
MIAETDQLKYYKCSTCIVSVLVAEAGTVNDDDDDIVDDDDNMDDGNEVKVAEQSGRIIGNKLKPNCMYLDCGTVIN